MSNCINYVEKEKATPWKEWLPVILACVKLLEEILQIIFQP